MSRALMFIFYTFPVLAVHMAAVVTTSGPTIESSISSRLPVQPIVISFLPVLCARCDYFSFKNK
jgi:hypothetical protein